MAFYGIDVSHHEGRIDWQQAKVNGPQFCFVRVGYANGDGSLTLDREFERNMQGLQATCIDTGLYLYSYLRTEAAAARAAEEFLAEAEPWQLTMPLVLDMEETGIYAGLGRALTTAIARSFLSAVGQAGYYPMLYANTNFAENYLDMQALSDVDFWVADYRMSLGYTGPYGIWQYTDQGVVEGIPDRVDLNLARRDYPALIKRGGYNRLPAWRRILPGDRVQLLPGAATYANSATPLPQEIWSRSYTVAEIRGGTALLGEICSWVFLRDLQAV